MGRSKGNLKRGVPARIGNPPNTQVYPEGLQDGKNVMRLHPSYIERRNYEKKQQKSR